VLVGRRTDSLGPCRSGVLPLVVGDHDLVAQPSTASLGIPIPYQDGP
jgi:hypothetical protein